MGLLAALDGFSVHDVRFVCEVVSPLELPPHKGPSLRGALFDALRRQFCVAPAACGAQATGSDCPVCFLFAPVDAGAARGRDLPRPYAFRPPLDPRTRYAPGDAFAFHLLTFGRALSHFPYTLLGVQEMGRQGLGRLGGAIDVREVWAENELAGRSERIYQAPKPSVMSPALPQTGDDVLAAIQRFAGADALRLRFHLPLRLVEGGRLVDAARWRFRPFMQRLLERLAALADSYGAGATIPFAELLAQADRIGTTANALRWWDLFRYSSRQGRKLPMGGLVGEVTVTGDLEPLLPWLMWGQLTHVGKYADHGNGWYELVPAR